MEPQSASCCGQLSQSPEVTESLLSSANQRVPQGSLSVLLLEPCRADAESILEELRNAGMPVAPTLVTSRDEFELAIQGAEFTAILSAYRLPGGNGLDALRLLRKNGNTTPFLLVTGSLGEDAAVECMKQGVSDYVLKDHLTRLPVALKRALEEGDLRHANAQVRMALTESEARNRELVENSVYGIFQISLEGTFHRANPSLLQMLTCNALEELRSLNLARDVFRYPEHYVKLVAACREHGLVHSEESEWRRKDGGLLSVRIHLRRLSVPGTGEILEGIVEDVTEVRALEHQLQQAQKFEAIGQLAGGIAHDFNNVVGAILGWAELGYEQSRDYPMIAERFARIREQADRAAGLTRELLAFARRQPLQVRPVDLNAIVSNFTGFLDKVIGKDIEIKGIPGPLPRIKADSTQLEQVLMNLCLNARDAMPDGGRLTVKTEVVHVDDSFCRLHPGVLPGRYAVLSVADTGTGMSPDVRDRVFEPFFTTKEHGKGSGMGLATVYGIVKQHGGFIHVYSELGQGSLFRVYLPATEEVPEELPPSTSVTLVNKLRGSETILLAEDHDSIREMVRQALVGLGYRVLAAQDGEQALRLCEKEIPAVAVLDVIMPHMGGPATATTLQARLPQLPIVFTSGYSENAGAAASQVTSSRYLQKPYSPISLCQIIRELLDSCSP